nr:cytochrome p450 4728A1 [Polyphagotarsonemus latus]
MRGIKGPEAVYFFGNTIDEFFDDPNYKERDYLSKYGQCFGTYKGLRPVFNTSKPEHIRFILNSPNIFHSLGNFSFYDNYFKHSVLFKNGKEWSNGRKALTHFFSGANIKNSLENFDSSINNFFSNVEFDQKKENSDSADFKIIAAYMCIDLISKITFSFDVNSYREKWSYDVRNILSIIGLEKIKTVFACIFPKAFRDFFKITGIRRGSVNFLGDKFKALVRERELDRELKNDLADSIKDANMKKNLNLTENEMIGNCLINYYTGVSPLSDSLSSIMYHLLHNPEEKQKLIKEIETKFSDGIIYEQLVDNTLLHAVIKESLRLISPKRIFIRTAMVDTKIGNYIIEKGTEVGAVCWIPNNSAKYFPNPEKFDPSRFLNKSSSNPNKINKSTFLPFGDGPKAADYKKQIYSSRESSTFNNLKIAFKKKE